jgi:hypothetical protein
MPLRKWLFVVSEFMRTDPLPPAKPLPMFLRIAGLGPLLFAVAEATVHLDFQQPFIGYGLGGVFLLFLAARPAPRRIAVVFGLASAIAVVVLWGRYEGLPTLLVQGMGSLGLASLFWLSCVVVWKGRRDEPSAYRALLPGGALTFLILGAMYSLNMASLLHAKTLDLYAYVFDGAVGFQPSFLAARFLKQHPWLFPLVKLSYEGIVLAMAALYAAFMRRREQPVWELIELLFAPAMIGYLFFSVFPVCGPHYAFPLDFPNAYLPYGVLHRLALERIPVMRAFPRNGVPSLHMTWALLIWLNTRGLPRWMRAVAAALAVATVFDTLATGEHYLFDLIVALPFTLCMQSCLVRTVSFRKPEKWKPAVAGAAMFLVWLVVGRYGLQWMLLSRAFIWALVGASSIISLLWMMRLPAMIPEQIPSSEPKVKTMAATAR